MKTCRDCKEIDCYRDQYADSAACEDFTSEAIEEVLPDWQPTLADFEKLEGLHLECLEEVTRLETRLAGYENAIAELVRFAQGDEAP